MKWEWILVSGIQIEFRRAQVGKKWCLMYTYYAIDLHAN